MPLDSLFIRLRSVSLIAAAVLFLTSAWAADHQTVLYSFGGPPDGTDPVGSLLMDSAGNLYGATFSGGIYCAPFYNCGTVFKLSRTPGGGWTETVIHDFSGLDGDGTNPNGSLIMDAAGNLYGTTALTAFELSPNQDGTWTEKTLCKFNFDGTGLDPDGGLVMDAAGNLYGVTLEGGGDMQGTAFELVRNGGGCYVMYSFGIGDDGKEPMGNLVVDAAGNVFGTTYAGGNAGGGTVFELSLFATGGWREIILHSFSGSDGYGPKAGLVMDAAGNLFGTTSGGGNAGVGTVFELSPVAGGGWTETTVYSFNGGPDGSDPESGLTLDAHGNLYGTTPGGGLFEYGTAFELSPRQGGWRETVLYSFEGSSDGGLPTSGLITDRAADLYGVTPGMGIPSVVYELTPPLGCGTHCPSTEH
jgi:uncharacterized repeat protein (TIGR03803 family)